MHILRRDSFTDEAEDEVHHLPAECDLFSAGIFDVSGNKLVVMGTTISLPVKYSRCGGDDAEIVV
jgi:hypothetical protein